MKKKRKKKLTVEWADDEGEEEVSCEVAEREEESMEAGGLKEGYGENDKVETEEKSLWLVRCFQCWVTNADVQPKISKAFGIINFVDHRQGSNTGHINFGERKDNDINMD